MSKLVPARRLALALALLAPFSSPALARRAATQEELPSARAVVDRYVEVTHLREALARSSSMHVKGAFALEAMGIRGAAEIWSAKPDLRLVSMEMGAFGTMVTGYDGRTAWMTHPMMGTRVLKGTDLLPVKLEAAFDAALKPEAAYESLRTLARETFEGKDCYKVEVVARPLTGMDAELTRAVRTSVEYYEVASGLLIGTTGRQEGEMGGGPFTAVHSDYRDFGGQLLATKTHLRQAGQEILLTVESVEYDTAAASTFALPVEVQKLVAAGEAPAAVPPK